MGNQIVATADTIAKRGEAASAKMAQNMANQQRETMLRMRELQMATAMARARDLTKWFGTAWCTAGVLGSIGYAKRGNPTGLIALVPLSFITAFNYDMGYGNKLQRIRAEATQILAEERAAHRGARAFVKFLPPDNNMLVNRAAYFDIFRGQPLPASVNAAAMAGGHPPAGSGKGKCPF